MATKKQDKTVEETIDIMEIERGRVTCRVIGTTPMICNALSAKTKKDLLLPPRKKNNAEKESTPKHLVLREFQDSIYQCPADAPTLIGQPATSFKNALCGVATDLPGSTKAQMSRLTFVPGDLVCIYGVPEMLMSIVRQAGQARTPDVRTRAILRNWCAEIDITFIKPLLTHQHIVRFLAAAGMMQGIGDWRPQRGKGDYGQFELVADANDKRYAKIVAEGGREAQEDAMTNPAAYDHETQRLWSWYDDEFELRGFSRKAEDKVAA